MSNEEQQGGLTSSHWDLIRGPQSFMQKYKGLPGTYTFWSMIEEIIRGYRSVCACVCLFVPDEGLRLLNVTVCAFYGSLWSRGRCCAL